jgi:hypothetical protein
MKNFHLGFFLFLLVACTSSQPKDTSATDNAKSKDTAANVVNTNEILIDNDGNLSQPVPVPDALIAYARSRNNESMPAAKALELLKLADPKMMVINSKLNDWEINKFHIREVNMDQDSNKELFIYMECEKRKVNPIMILNRRSGKWNITFLCSQAYRQARVKMPEILQEQQMFYFEQEDWNYAGNAIVRVYYRNVGDGKMANCFNFVEDLVRGYDSATAHSFVRTIKSDQQIDKDGNITALVNERFYVEDKGRTLRTNESIAGHILYSYKEPVVFEYDARVKRYRPKLEIKNHYNAAKLASMSLSANVAEVYRADLSKLLSNGGPQDRKLVYEFTNIYRQ